MRVDREPLHAALTLLQRRLTSAAEVVRAHPRKLAAGVGGALLLSSAAAYALVDLAPPLPPPSVQSVAVEVDAAGQTQALAGVDLTYATSTSVRRQDSVQSLLRRLGVTDPGAIRQLATDAHLRALVAAGQSDEPVHARVNGQGELVQFDALLRPAAGDLDSAMSWQVLQGRPDADGNLQLAAVDVPVERRARLVQAEVQSSLNAALWQARVPRDVGGQLVKLFAPQIDLRRALRKGDKVALVYAVDTIDGREVRTGRLLAAELDTRGHALQAVWFKTDEHAKGGYFTPDGRGLEKVWARSPLPGARVTSPFGMRVHPVSHRREMHDGVDFAAPIGTPVPSVSDGRVIFAGVQNGYGNVIKLRHPGGFETLYAHLSRIQVKVGQSVSEGDIIGRTGNTGTSTGAHLHFEFHANGQLRNPLQMAKYVPQGRPLAPGDKAAFFAATAVVRTQLAQAAGQDSLRYARAD